MTISDLPETVSIVRRNLLRACHLLLVVGLGLTAWPRFLSSGTERPLMDGVVDAMLCGLQLLAIVGLFAPVRMLPVILFDIVWKALWVIVVAVPAVMNGRMSPGVTETLFACAWAIPFLLIVPWRYAFRAYVREAEPWRRSAAHG